MPLFKVLRDAGVPMDPENGQTGESATTWVIHFPVKAPDGAITRQDRSAIEQCEYWPQNKIRWTEHDPSVTITYAVSTDDGGSLTVAGIPFGVYGVGVKQAHSLSNLVAGVTVGVGSVNVDFCELKEGDVDGNDCVMLPDFSLLAVAFDTQAGDLLFEPRADFSEDGFVTLPDFSMLAGNYDTCGPVVCAEGQVAGPAEGMDQLVIAPRMASPDLTESGSACIEAVPATQTVEIGQSFVITVTVTPTSVQVNGAEMHLDFDPSLMQVIGVTPGSALPVPVTGPTFDNALGMISYAAGIFSGYVSEPFVPAVIEMEAITVTESAWASFDFEFLRLSQVTSTAGQDVLDCHSDAQVVVEAVED